MMFFVVILGSGDACALVQVRAGEPVSQYDVVKFAQLFNDELTLDNLERIHLVNLCRFVGIQPFGTDAFLVSCCVSSASYCCEELHENVQSEMNISEDTLHSLSDFFCFMHGLCRLQHKQLKA